MPILYMDTVLVVLEPPNVETDSSISRAKRNLVAGGSVIGLQWVDRRFDFELPAVLDAFFPSLRNSIAGDQIFCG